MKKEYDFSRGARGRFAQCGPRARVIASTRGTPRKSGRAEDELTPAQVRELRRRMADLRDTARYILVSQMAPRFSLYYNVSEDVYVMNDPNGATLFKRGNAAVAIKKLLGGRIRVVRCNSRRINGVRVPVLRTRRGRRRAPASRESSRRGVHATAPGKRGRERQTHGARRG